MSRNANACAMDSPCTGMSNPVIASARSDNMPQWYRRGVTSQAEKLKEINGFLRLRPSDVLSDAR